MRQPASPATLPVRAVVLDFDGTVCRTDVSDMVIDTFGSPLWRELDREYERGEIGSRDNLLRMAGLVHGSREAIERYVLDHHEVDPSFPPFVSWARARGLPLVVVSDGLGFHIEPLLTSAGLQDIEIVANRTVFRDGEAPELSFPAGHPECRWCGTCKMLAVTRTRDRHGPVAFVGDGHSDRFGALYADVVFAKAALAELCRREGVPFLPWDTFEDVREGLERLGRPPGPVAPERCPGWVELADRPAS